MPGTSQRRPTIKDVAHAAGVSHATVSRYLTKHSYVSREAGRQIDRAIIEVGYVPNRAARSLVQRESRCVAFVVREHSDLFFTDAHLSRVAVTANELLGDAGYQMLLLIVDDDRSAGRVSELIRGGFVDGAILVAVHHDDPVLAGLDASAVPMVLTSTPRGFGSIPTVDTDNVGGTAAVTAELIATGRQRIAEIAGPRVAAVTDLRHAGFVRAMGEAFDPRLVVHADEWSRAAGARAVAELLERDASIDGVVAASDLIATGAVQVLHESGRRVPDDVGVVGFDDAPWAVQCQPPLCTVRQDAAAAGRAMVETVLRQIAGEQLTGTSLVLPNDVIRRESVGTSVDVVPT